MAAACPSHQHQTPPPLPYKAQRRSYALPPMQGKHFTATCQSFRAAVTRCWVLGHQQESGARRHHRGELEAWRWGRMARAEEGGQGASFCLKICICLGNCCCQVASEHVPHYILCPVCIPFLGQIAIAPPCATKAACLACSAWQLDLVFSIFRAFPPYQKLMATQLYTCALGACVCTHNPAGEQAGLQDQPTLHVTTATPLVICMRDITLTGANPHSSTSMPHAEPAAFQSAPAAPAERGATPWRRSA